MINYQNYLINNLKNSIKIIIKKKANNIKKMIK
jgi:hypothetical protein